MKDGKHVDANGNKFWYKNGKLHRGGGKPAIVYTNGSKWWYKKGKLHRGRGKPANTHVNGDKYWYKNDQLHRDGDKPTLVYANGTRYWYRHDMLHRDGDRPAIEWADGHREWYTNGQPYQAAREVNLKEPKMSKKYTAAKPFDSDLPQVGLEDWIEILRATDEAIHYVGGNLRTKSGECNACALLGDLFVQRFPSRYKWTKKRALKSIQEGCRNKEELWEVVFTTQVVPTASKALQNVLTESVPTWEWEGKTFSEIAGLLETKAKGLMKSTPDN